MGDETILTMGDFYAAICSIEHYLYILANNKTKNVQRFIKEQEYNPTVVTKGGANSFVLRPATSRNFIIKSIYYKVGAACTLNLGNIALPLSTINSATLLSPLHIILSPNDTRNCVQNVDGTTDMNILLMGDEE